MKKSLNLKLSVLGAVLCASTPMYSLAAGGDSASNGKNTANSDVCSRSTPVLITVGVPATVLQIAQATADRIGGVHRALIESRVVGGRNISVSHPIQGVECDPLWRP
jgi:hypothetical protein